MRELKFRAWNGSSMTVVGVGYLGVAISYGFKPVEWIDSKEWTVMQYTGLKDNNGVEIYEGDVVSLWYAPRSTAKGRIKFENGGFYFKTTEAKPNICLVYDCVYKHKNEFTVIGNIYENPELLNEAKS